MGWDWAARAASRRRSAAGEESGASGGPGRTGGSLPVAGTPGRPPKTASKTRRSASMWSLLATRVASAHRYRPDAVTGRATVTARANRSHRPGSAGTPAARSAAPNLAATRARSSPGTTSIRPPGGTTGAPPPAPATPPPAPATPAGASGTTGTPSSGLIGDGQRREPSGAHGLQVFGVLEHRPRGLARRGAVEAGRPEHVQRPGPADGFRDTRRLGQIEAAQPVHPASDLAGQDLRGGRHPAPDDRRDAPGVRVVDPVVEAAPLERVVQVTSPVRGQHDDRAEPGPAGAEFRDGDRRFGEQLEQEGLELVVAAVHLVDQQHGRPGAGMIERGEQRAGRRVLVVGRA